MDPYTLKASEGWTYRDKVVFTVKAGELHPGRGATFVEYTTVKGEEPPEHTHATEDEMFYVLEGELTVRCRDESFDVGEGSFVFLPKGIEHGYTIRSEGPARLLVVTYPPSVTPGRGWGGFIASVETQGKLLSEPDDKIRS
ncbi:MAG: cupin domain-containing protein [Anaerolineae bacterium]|nr:cupin domain-containing protein [Anaerolineae bacterium]